MTIHELSRTDARRIAVRAQLLDANAAPQDLIGLVRHLSFLQLDTTNAVGPSAELVAWGRLGRRHALGDVTEAVDVLDLIELHGLARPAQDIELYLADMEGWLTATELTEWQEDVRDWFAENEACRRDIIGALRSDGPLPAAALPDTCVVPWTSSGWNHHRNVGRMLEIMVACGQVAAAGRDGGVRVWDLATRVYPDVAAVPTDEARRARDERRLRALGIARSRAAQTPNEPNDVGDVGESAVVDGVRGEWRVDPTLLDGSFRGRMAVVSPLDRLVFDRKRMEELFEFDYQLEMYKPAAKRRWGYWAMPVLYGDRLVGKVDATADRVAGVLHIDAIHRDVDFSVTMDSKLDRELRALARMLELEPISR